jgi:predicted nucleic acid-binding protein
MKLDYFDSSAILAMLLNQEQEQEAYALWRNDNIKISSVLLKIETRISLNRFHRAHPHLKESWLTKKHQELEDFLSYMLFHAITENFADNMAKKNKELAHCKSLDAIHIATALLAGGKYGNENVRVCTMDKAMAHLAQEFGFAV